MDNLELKKVLRPIDLWGIAVGLVISGEYFGWSYGWSVAGTIGFLIATIIVAIMYTALVFSLTELTTAIPNAAGPFAYVRRALGERFAAIAGAATLMEFLFASPAIAFALGSYVHFIFPDISVSTAACGVLIFFTLINLLGVKQTMRFELIVTIIAVLELVIFMVVVFPHFRWERFVAHTETYSWQGILAAIPYAIWFFLAIEGVAMAAEEVEKPASDIPKGYLSGIATIIFLALGVMLGAGGVGDWRTLSHMDYPVPEAMGMALGKTSVVVKLLAGIGIFGLIASLNGIIYSCSRQVFALARAGFLPKPLRAVSKRYHAPYGAVLLSTAVGLISIASGTTSKLITLSAFGALLMYVISMAALLVLRRTEPHLHRPYRVPLYPAVPMIALILSTACFIALVMYNLWLAAIFALIMAVGFAMSVALKSPRYGRS